MLTKEQISSKLNLDTLIEFLGTQDPFEEYKYASNKRCVWGRLLNAEENDLLVGGDSITSRTFIVPLSPMLNRVVNSKMLPERTFGCVLELARKVKAGEVIYSDMAREFVDAE